MSKRSVKVVPNPEQKGWEENGTTAGGTPIYKWESGGGSGGGLWEANGDDIYYSDGSVGIGTDSPADYGSTQRNLAVNGSAVSRVELEIGESPKGGVLATSTEFRSYANAGVDLTYWNGGTEAMRIDGAGNVGIGMTPEVVTFDLSAKEQLKEWKTKAKKASWSVVTDGAFEQEPTEDLVTEWMETRAAGYRLQVDQNICAHGIIRVDSTHPAARMLYLNATTNNTATYRQALGIQHSGTDMLSIATGPVVSISSKANQLKLENDGGSLVIDNNGAATFSSTIRQTTVGYGQMAFDGTDTSSEMQVISINHTALRFMNYNGAIMFQQGTDQNNIPFVIGADGLVTVNGGLKYIDKSIGTVAIEVNSQYGAGGFGCYNNYPAMMYNSNDVWAPSCYHDYNNNIFNIGADFVHANGSPIARTRDLITTLSTLRKATMDETQDIREALRSAIDELVEGFEQQIATMPAEDSE